MSEDRQPDQASPGQASPDPLDGVIDAALRTMGDTPPVDLRLSVLARLDGGDRGSAGPWGQPFAVLLRPAAMALVGTLVILFGIVASWQHANRHIEALQSRPAGRMAREVGKPLPGDMAARAVEPTVAKKTAPTDAGAPAAGLAARRGRQRAFPEGPERPVLAASLAGGILVDDFVSLFGNEPAGPCLPGAPAGDLGDPILPMPPPRPITFVPVVPAPPVSDLAMPVSAVPAGEPTRDPSGPNQSGGNRR
ncbi:MAG TPA: hypothetical protein VGK32_18450 [Vicinamibacterales bacterium]|jgi:hypothetical protein